MGASHLPQELWRIKREAAAESRPSNAQIDESAQRPKWVQIAGQFGGAEQVVAAVTTETRPAAALVPEDVELIVELAVNELSEQRSTWRRGHLVTEIARMLPSGFDASLDQVVRLCSLLADNALEQSVIAQVGSADDSVSQLFTTKDALEEEFAVMSWAVEAVEPLPGDGQPAELNQRVSAFAEFELAGGQLAAAAAAAGDGEFELIVGLAGAGKTSALKAAVGSLQDESRAVFGLAPSGVAAQVLGDETGCDSENVSKFLWEHNDRDGGPLPQYQLATGTTLLVDEAGMVRTSDWGKLCALADEHQGTVKQHRQHLLMLLQLPGIKRIPPTSPRILNLRRDHHVHMQVRIPIARPVLRNHRRRNTGTLAHLSPRPNRRPLMQAAHQRQRRIFYRLLDLGVPAVNRRAPTTPKCPSAPNTSCRNHALTASDQAQHSPETYAPTTGRSPAQHPPSTT